MAKGGFTKVKEYKAKSLLSEEKAYFAEFVMADVFEDLDGDEIPTDTLFTKINGMIGDLEHAKLFGREDIPHQDLFKVIDSFYDGERLLGEVMFFPEHPLFPQVWDMCKKGKFGISMEYEPDFSDIHGVTGTIVGRNPRSKIINAYAM